MTERKAGIFEKIGARLGIIRQETNLEKEIIKPFAGLVVDQIKKQRDEGKKRWEESGSNFWERMKSTAKSAWEDVKSGWEKVSGVVKEKMESLKVRYQEQGIWGASLGIVNEAVETVRELPVSIREKLNSGRAFVEQMKVVLIEEKQDKFHEVQGEGWAEKFALLNLTNEHVKSRRDLFLKRVDDCKRRLAAIQEGRNKFSQAAGQKTKENEVLTVVPEAE